MKFTILKESLEQALNISIRGISNRSARPILSGIKLELNDNGLFLTSSDSYISIVTKIPLVDNNNKTNITLFEKGTIVVSAKSFNEIIRKFDGERLEIEAVENNIIKIRDEVSDFSLNCLESNDYPIIDFNLQGSSFSIPSKDFSKAINQTSYAALEKDTKPVLQGVNISANGNTIDFVATDIYRIAKKSISTNEYLQFSVTVPTKIITDVARIADLEETIKVTVSERKITFKFENTLISASCINGAYPDVSRLIPTTYSSVLTANSSKLLSSIDRTSSLALDKQSIVRLSMSSDEVQVKSRTQETGSGSDRLIDFTYDGNNLDVSFTSKYLMDAIKSLDCEEVKIKFNGDSSPVIIINAKDSSTFALLLPVRTY